MRRVLAASLLAVALPASAFEREPFDESGFVALFDGSSLSGWRVNAETWHSRASGNQSGGAWTVENGAIVGRQDLPGNGGILITEASFGDFEVALEMNNDFGSDSGLFLRSTRDGRAYQCLIDYLPGGSIAGIYGEGLAGDLFLVNFVFGPSPQSIVPQDKAPFPLPVAPEAWPRLWKPGAWNEIRARIVGNPPRITTWINGVRFMEFADNIRRHPDRGAVALQVHGGAAFAKLAVRYRNLRIKRLD
ncbi:MAG: DUF1080 domain-containing protein [Alphaproteobacteria bacterium]|nr:DUF1080 domain-containing protein [Alphaproteobacteria bacterium]